MSTKLDWTEGRGVPIDDATRDNYAQKLVKQLEDDPDQGMIFVATGDMFILAHIDKDGHITVEDLEPRRWACIESKSANKASPKCTCELKMILQSGCQCGGA